MSVTLQDIAKKTNYSKATVCRVLNNKGKKSNSKAAKIIKDAAEKLNYRPHFGAQVLAKGKSSHVAVIVPEITYTMFIMRLEAGLSSLDLNMLPISTHWDPQKEAETLKKLPGGLDIIINLHYWKSNVPVYKEMAEQGYRQVFYVLEEAIENVDFDCVGTNAGMGTYHLFRHLWDKGFRKIGVVGGFCADEVSKRDFRGIQSKGYKQAHDELGIEVVRERAICCESTQMDAFKAVSSALKEKKGLFDALILYSDDLTAGTYKALDNLGITVPDEMGIATFGDIHSPFAELYETTIWARSTDRICQGIVSLLKNHISKESSSIQKMFYESTLIERKSTSRN